MRSFFPTEILDGMSYDACNVLKNFTKKCRYNIEFPSVMVPGLQPDLELR